MIHGITATVFGGAADNERSAYAPYELLDDIDIYLSLPDRFEGARPRVEVQGAAGRVVVADIMDVGPWMTDDPYWMFNRRPVAETCHLNKTSLPSGPNKGKVPSNPAGMRSKSGVGEETWCQEPRQGVLEVRQINPDTVDIKALMMSAFDQAFMTQIAKLYQVYNQNAPSIEQQREFTRKGIENAIELYRLAIQVVNDWQG